MSEDVHTGFMNGLQDGERDGHSGNGEDIHTEMSPLKKSTKCRISVLQAGGKPWLGSVERMNRLTPVKAIRKYCIQCAGNQKAPRRCDNKICPLFDFRLGKHPGRVGIGGRRNRKDSDNSSGQNLRKKRIVGVASG